VHEAGGVRVREGTRDLLADPGGPLLGQVTEAGDLRGEGFAGHEPHDDPRGVVVLGHVVDRDHAGVVEPGRRAGLAHRDGDEVGVFLRWLRRERDLPDRHVAVEQFVARQTRLMPP